MSQWTVRRVCVCAALAALVVAGAANPALAQQVRVTSGPVQVMQWRNAGETVGTVDTGAILQIIERDGDWLWIVLPADVFGTRRVGWVPASSVEPTALKDGMPVLQISPAPGSGGTPMASQPAMRPVRRPSAGGPRWLLEGFGGTTFGTETAEYFGGSVGVQVRPRLQAIVEIGRFDNIVSEDIEDRATVLAARPEQYFLLVTGRSLDVTPETHVPAVYGTVGLRMSTRAAGRAHPYVSGGIGLASVKPELRLRLGTEEITSDFVSVSELPEDRTRMMLSGGGGVALGVVDGVVFDVGYRYARVFYGDGLNVNRVYLGLGFVF